MIGKVLELVWRCFGRRTKNEKLLVFLCLIPALVTQNLHWSTKYIPIAIRKTQLQRKLQENL